MSWLLKWIWKPETPARVPAGARISAGKSGKVAMSLPARAEVLVNWVPASCIPSPESPANRMVIDSTSSTLRGWPLGGAAAAPVGPFVELMNPCLERDSRDGASAGGRRQGTLG